MTALPTRASRAPSAARLIRDPWLGRPWDVGAAAVMTGIGLASRVLTGWLLGRQSSRA